MPIYSRDNIQYSNMLQNMLANRAKGAEIRANNIRGQGELWGGTIKNIGSMVGRAYAGYAGADTGTDESELQELMKEREELLKQQEEEMRRAREMQAQSEYASAMMQGYHPNAYGVYGGR